MRNEVTKKDIEKLYSGILKLQESVSRLEAKIDTEQSKELLTPDEVCELLGIKRRTYQHLVKKEVIAQVKPGGKRNSPAFVMRDNVNKLLNGGVVDV